MAKDILPQHIHLKCSSVYHQYTENKTDNCIMSTHTYPQQVEIDDTLCDEYQDEPCKGIIPPTTPIGMQATDGEAHAQAEEVSGEYSKYKQPYEQNMLLVEKENVEATSSNESEGQLRDINEALRKVNLVEPRVLDTNNDITGGKILAAEQAFEEDDTTPGELYVDIEATLSIQSTDGNRMLCHPSGDLEEEDEPLSPEPLSVQEAGGERFENISSTDDAEKEKGQVHCPHDTENEPELKSSYEVIDEQEPFQQWIGSGTFGKVYKYVDKHGVRCVKRLEVYPADEGRWKAVMAEMDIHPTLEHPNIVEHYYNYEDTNEKDHFQTFNVEMELMEGGSLGNVLSGGTLSDRCILSYTKQLLEGVQYMHQQNVVHRDIKPENILLDAKHEQLKIADFGTAIRLKDGLSVREISPIGTARYIAPEVWRCEPHGKPADIWSVGATVVAMVNGKSPFYKQNIDDQNAFALMFKVGKDDARPLVQRNICNQLDEVINSCLCFNPHDRPSAEELLQKEIFAFA